MRTLSDRERLVAEQAVETLRTLDRAADAAPHGQGMAFLEAAVHDEGFGLLRSIMASAAGARDEAQKGACFRDCPCGGRAEFNKFKACRPRRVLTTVGHVAFGRRRYHCPSCSAGSVPPDDWGGVGDRSLTAGARRVPGGC